MKCSKETPTTRAEEYTPNLHILMPSVQHFINLTRFDGFPDYPFWFNREEMALVPYLQPVPLSLVPLPEIIEISSDSDGFEWSIDTSVSLSDSEEDDNLLRSDEDYARRIEDQLKRQAMHLDEPLYVGDDSDEKPERPMLHEYLVELEFYSVLTTAELDKLRI